MCKNQRKCLHNTPQKVTCAPRESNRVPPPLLQTRSEHQSTRLFSPQNATSVKRSYVSKIQSLCIKFPECAHAHGFFRSQNSARPSLSAANIARPGFFRSQNSPPGPKSLKFHRKSAPPDLPEAPGVPPALHAALGMDLSWFWEGHMRSSMVNNSKLELFGTHPRIPRIPTFPRIRCHQPRLGTTLTHAPGVRMT